ncbi:MAG: hypothetical protein ABH862_00500, partial [Candidatus Omnitrophota bacterium]
QTDEGGKKCLWVGSGGRLSKIEPDDMTKEKMPYDDVLSDREISVQKVQEMAIEYAEVSHEKIKRWREEVRWKAFFPKLSLSFSESNDENIEIYKSATTSYTVEGPRQISNDWGVDVSWDLSDIVWNDSQTSIDVRSKLMVQLREEVLEEVTRLYFERKRVLLETHMLKEKYANSPEIYSKERADKLLKAEELTAYIDALTGGGFSRTIEKKNKS